MLGSKRRGAELLVPAWLAGPGPALGTVETGEPADCRLRPPFLLAEDDTPCGGLNVSFTNAYRRTNP